MFAGQETCQLRRLFVRGRSVISQARTVSLNNILLRGVCGWLPRCWVRRYDCLLLADLNLP